MKIAILSRNAGLYSTRRLVEAAQTRGHEADVIDVLKCYMNIASDDPKIHMRGEELPHYDAVIPGLARRSRFMVPRYSVSLR